MIIRSYAYGLSAVICSFALAACGGGGGAAPAPATPTSPTTPPNTFTLGGTVSGLVGSGLVLRNGGVNLTVTQNGAFTFSPAIATGSAYAVTVLTSPSAPAQSCNITSGSGTITGANVTNVQVVCTTNTYSIGGTLSGLASSNVQIKNGTETRTLTADGVFTFQTALLSGSPYVVTITSQPNTPPQICSLANGSGTVVASNITNIAVTCIRLFSVSGTVTGVTGVGSGVTLINNGGDALKVTTDGSFTFTTTLVGGSVYDVRVLTPPEASRCVLTNERGTIAAASISNIAVNCIANIGRIAVSLDFDDASYSSYAVADYGQLRPLSYVRVGANPIDVVRDASESFALVLSRGTGTLSVFKRDEDTGVLTEAPNSPFATGALPTPGSSVSTGTNVVVAHPKLEFVYVVTGAGGPQAHKVAGFSINATTGELTQIPGSPFAAGTDAGRLVIDSTGRFAYLPNRTSGDVYTYSINQATGALTEIANSRVATGVGSIVVYLHPNGKFVYVANSLTGTLSTFTANLTTGVLTAVGSPLSIGSTFTGTFAIHRSGAFAYARLAGVTSPIDQSGSLSAFNINQTTGALTPIASYPIGANSGGIAIDSYGRYMYVVNRGVTALNKGSISHFRINGNTGALTALAGVINLTPVPSTINVSPNGKYVYSASAAGNLGRAFEVDEPTDSLSIILGGSEFAMRDNPIFLVSFGSLAAPYEHSFATRFVYVPNVGDGTIAAYPISTFNGLLDVPDITTLNGTKALAVDAQTRFLFDAASNGGVGELKPFDIDQGSGFLTDSTPSTPSGTSPVAMARDLNGRFLYVADNGTNTIRVNSIDKTTGALNEVVPTVPVTLTQPVALAVHPTGRFLAALTDSTVTIYKIDAATGGLTAVLGGANSNGGTGKNSFVYAPNGVYAFAARDTGAGGEILRYRVNPDTGVLTYDGFEPTTVSAHSVAIAGTGLYLFVTHPTTNEVSGYWVYFDGTLHALTNSPFPVVNNPTSMAFDFQLFDFFVVSGADKQIAQYRINSFSNGLMLRSSRPTGTNPGRVVVSEDILPQ